MPHSLSRLARRATALLVVAGLAACGAAGTDADSPTATTTRQPLSVASFNFTENVVLAHVYAQALEDAGYPVRLRTRLGNRELVQPAVERGEVDVVPEYLGSALEFRNQGVGEATADVAATLQKLRDRLAPAGLVALEPSPAADANAFFVTKATAARLQLTKMSDLTAVADQLTLGGPVECPVRPFCLPGLERVYGLRFRAFKPLDTAGPRTRDALDAGEVDVALLFSTDESVASDRFAVLQDDKGLQAAENVVPVVRRARLDPVVRATLDEVSGALTTKDLAAFTAAVDGRSEDPAAVARRWHDQRRD